MQALVEVGVLVIGECFAISKAARAIERQCGFKRRAIPGFET